MFKNFFDSLFIIDPKEKPAPSFLLAYIFTWLVVQHEVTLAFFKTNGDFTTRFNASLNLTNEMEYGFTEVLGITLVVVLIRFILNGVIYYMRELIENKTQDFLILNKHKSPVSYEIFHEQQIKISELQTSLLSSQDREKIAKELEQTADSNKHNVTIERDKYKAQFDEQIRNNNSLTSQLQSSEKKVQNNEMEIEAYASNQYEYKGKIKDLESERDWLLLRNNTVVQRLKLWSNNAENEYINLINHVDTKESGINKDANEQIKRLLDSRILYSDTSEKDLTGLISRIKMSDTVRELTEKLNNIAVGPSSTSEEIAEKVKLLNGSL